MKVAACKINGKDGYVCSYKLDGAYKRKYFYSRKDALSWERQFRDAQSISEKKSLTLLKSQIDDIHAALKILPEGKTLYEAVCLAFSNYSACDIGKFVNDFNNVKAASGVCPRHLNIVQGRTKALLSRFQSFNDATPKSLFDYISTKGKSRKTIVEWFNTLNEFFKFCVRRDAITSNPLDKWTINDFGRPKSK